VANVFEELFPAGCPVLKFKGMSRLGDRSYNALTEAKAHARKGQSADSKIKVTCILAQYTTSSTTLLIHHSHAAL
jgi:hypothetical protein